MMNRFQQFSIVITGVFAGSLLSQEKNRHTDSEGLKRFSEQYFSKNNDTFFGRLVGVEGEVVSIEQGLLTIKTSAPTLEWRKPAGEYTFQAVDILTNGKVHKAAIDSNAYLPSDLKKGDIVLLGTFSDTRLNIECVAEISIRKRLDGVVPPSQKPDKTNPFHEYQNLFNEYIAGKVLTQEQLKRIGKDDKLKPDLKAAPAKPDEKPQTDPMKK